MEGSEPTECPHCKSNGVYPDRETWMCAECGHEWTPSATNSEQLEEATGRENEVRDAHGNLLRDGDSVVVVKDLKIKGAAQTLKAGTKVRSIRLALDVSDGHSLSCKVEGIGAIHLKPEFVRKA